MRRRTDTHTRALAVRAMAVAIAALMAAACSTQQDYAYLNDAVRDHSLPIKERYEQRIAQADQLYISVYSGDPRVVVPYNQETNRQTKTTDVPGYVVDGRGEISFPSLGKLKVVGLSHDSLAHHIERRLREEGMVMDPVVSVSLMNFGVTVVGEVAEPQLVRAMGGRLTIFEALARCGDIKMTGMRNNVKILRLTEQGEIADSIDLTSSALLQSPYYYLRNGDILFVEPTPQRRREAYRNEDWPHYISTGTAAVRLAYLTVYRFYLTRYRQSQLNNR